MENVIRRVLSQGLWPKMASRKPVAFESASVRAYSKALYQDFSSSRIPVSSAKVLSGFTALTEHAHAAGDLVGTNRSHPGLSEPFFVFTLERSLRGLPVEKRRAVYDSLASRSAGAATGEIVAGLKSSGVSHDDLNKVRVRFTKLSQAMKTGVLSHIAKRHGVMLSKQDLIQGASALDSVSSRFPASASGDLDIFTNFQHYFNTGSTAISWLQIFANQLK